MPDESARVYLTRIIDLELADAFVCGWREMIMAELDRMRAIMPYADIVRITLISERHPDG